MIGCSVSSFLLRVPGMATAAPCVILSKSAESSSKGGNSRIPSLDRSVALLMLTHWVTASSGVILVFC